MNDQQIVQQLKKGKRVRAFTTLYKAYPPIEKLIILNGGTKEDAKDVFQNALIIFYQKALEADFQLTSKISTFLYSVCRYLWSDELKMKKHHNQLSENLQVDEAYYDEVSDYKKREESFDLMENVLLAIGDKCLKLLKLFYYEKLSMKKIAQKLDFSSENVAKNQKYKCLERAKKKLVEFQTEQNFQIH
jgi:RNA polymerase sigma factor (sigma-70 family)